MRHDIAEILLVTLVSVTYKTDNQGINDIFIVTSGVIKSVDI
jgi:hypothetical protein